MKQKYKFYVIIGVLVAVIIWIRNPNKQEKKSLENEILKENGKALTDMILILLTEYFYVIMLPDVVSFTQSELGNMNILLRTPETERISPII